MADIIKLHDLRPTAGANKPKTRVGRGEASKGKTAGRGTKGTGARKQVSAAFEGGQMPLHMRLPKLRGFRNPNRVEFQPVNVGRIAELFPEGGTVTVEDLVAKGAVRKNQLVKVLGGGDVTGHGRVDQIGQHGSGRRVRIVVPPAPRGRARGGALRGVDRAARRRPVEVGGPSETGASRRSGSRCPRRATAGCRRNALRRR